MPRRKRPTPNLAIIEMLEGYLQEAKDGFIQELYIVHGNDQGDFDDAYQTSDLQMLIAEVNQLSLRTRTRETAEAQAARKEAEEKKTRKH